MRAINKEILKQLPNTRNENKKGTDTMVYLKLYNKDGYEFYVTECSNESFLYGYYKSLNSDWCYYAIDTLEQQIKEQYMFIDYSFKPCKLKNVL